MKQNRLKTSLKYSKDNYILKVGPAGSHRLSIFNGAHNLSSQSFLRKVGIKSGMKILDIGCGNGQMSIWFAKQVGRHGKVYAVDASSEQLSVAKLRAKIKNINNIEFIQSSVYDLTFAPKSFDLIYCRYFLIHLANPKMALTILYKLLKSAGIMVCEEPTMSTSFCYPHSQAYIASRKLLWETAKIRKLDFEIGIKLYSIFSALGYKKINIVFAQPVLKTITEKKLIELLFLECKELYIKSGLVSKDKFQKLLHQLRLLNKRQTTLFALPRTTQICGYKNDLSKSKSTINKQCATRRICTFH